MVWVHDYHLLLLPSYILRKLRTTRVGLFLHIPFPSSEIFRTISVRHKLLTAHYSLLPAPCSLYCSLLPAHFSLLTAPCSLHTTHYSRLCYYYSPGAR